MFHAPKAFPDPTNCQAKPCAAVTAADERQVRCRLEKTLPLLFDEVRLLDQLLGAEIAKLFTEE